MANENQNSGPQLNQAGADVQNLRQGLKALLDDQGDYNNLLKTAISDLKSMDNAYSKIEARINALDRGSVNVKAVNQELYKLKQKEYIESRKLQVLQRDLGKETTDALDLAKKAVQVQVEKAARKGKEVDFEKTMMGYLKSTGNIEAIRLYTQEKQVKIAEKQTKLGEQALKTEKDVSKQMGISGNLMQKFAEKLGVGEEAYQAMADESRKLVEQNGKVGGFSSKLKVLQAGLKAGASAIKESFSDPVARGAMVVGAYKAVEGGLTKVGNAAASTGNFLAGMSEDSSNIVRGLASNVSGLVKNIPLVGGLLGGLIDGFAALADLALGVDNFVTKAGRELGLSKAEAKALNKQFIDMSYNSGNVFVNSKKLMESQIEISKQLGVNNLLTKEILETNIMLKDVAGLEAETRASIVETATITGKSAQGVTKSVLAQVVGLKQATGISLDYKQVLNEASKLGGYLGLSFAKYPAQLTKSLVTVKAMGLELKQLDSMADSFLDFESSISKEFEAQLLTGRDINLNKAREAFLNNDLATAAGEITKQVGSAADFLKLNRIQAESLASAFGMSRDQMGEMLKRQELLSKLGAKDTDNAQKQLELGLKKYQNQKALTEAIGEEAYQSLVTASTQEKMAGLIEKVKQSIVDFLTNSGILDKITGFMDYLSKPENVKAIVSSVKNFMADAVEFIGKAAYYILEGLDYLAFGQIPDSFIDSIKEGSANMGAQIRATGNGFGSTAGETTNNASKNETRAAAVASAEAGKMAYAPVAAEPKYYVLQVDPVTGQKIERQVSKEYFESQSGQYKKQ